MNIIDEWQSQYCSGSKMPIDFRKSASKVFADIYVNADKEELLEYKLKECNNILYRAISCNKYESERKLINFDNLYYSFSNDLYGLKEVIKCDRYLRSDILIIESKNHNGLNYNNIGNYLYKNYLDVCRYRKENEIVSKLTKDDLISIYFLKHSDNILEYKKYGIKIDKNDCSSSIKNIYKKYHLSTQN